MFAVAYCRAPVKVLELPIWSVYETAPATGCHEKTTGSVGKTRVVALVGVRVTGVVERLFVNCHALAQGPRLDEESSPATRQYRVVNGSRFWGVACRACVSTL